MFNSGVGFRFSLSARVFILGLMLWPVIWSQARPEESSGFATVQETFGGRKSSQGKWVDLQTYIPQKREYFLDLGSMWERKNMYWLGGELGFHVGRCLFSLSQTCQQYLDILGGVGGAEGVTAGLGLASLRWQFVNFPSQVSPLGRIFLGVINLHDDDRKEKALAAGLGYGLTTTVHPKMDLKFEVRIGVGYRGEVWGQAFVALGLKLDSWVDYFRGGQD